MNLEHYNKVRDLIRETEGSGFLQEVAGLTGFSGGKIIGALQRLAKLYSETSAGSYLEIGVFQGLTLISVASVLEDAAVYGVDNFAQFDPKGINEKIVSERAADNSLDNINLINADYEDALENLSKHVGGSKIGVYFIDGPHDYRSQLVCLNLAVPHLSACSAIVVDDCNYRHVRLANRDFLLANPEFKLIFEAYTESHPDNMNEAAEREARKGWWNGVNIIVRDPNNVLDVMLPETCRDRQLHENEHLVHSAKYGALAPEAVAFIHAALSLRLISALKQLAKMWMKMRKTRGGGPVRFSSMNTFSENLPSGNFNKTFR